MQIQDIHADLAQVVLGQRPGCTDASETFNLDSTGTAIKDLAAANMI